MKKFHLVWDENRYALGIPSLDSEHRSLMNLVNELSEAVAQDCDCEQARQKMEKILDFAADHFAHEEDLMRRHGFPGVQQHTADHEKLLREATNLMETLSPEHSNRALLITAFFTDFTENHILHEDRAISQYLEKQGIRAD
jgi:hemerythrin-like metal-binding protein